MAKILFDCDEVLLNWALGLRNYLRKTRGIETDGPRPSSWDLHQWTGMEDDAIQAVIGEFNEQSDDFGYLEPIHGAQEAVRQLIDLGHELVVVTSCSEEPVCIRRREQNLVDVFGDAFGEIHCLSRGVSKLETLEQFPSSIWVEDNFKNAVAGLEAGHRSMILEYPHNTEFKPDSPDAITWADGWPDLLPKMHAVLAEERHTYH